MKNLELSELFPNYFNDRRELAEEFENWCKLKDKKLKGRISRLPQNVIGWYANKIKNELRTLGINKIKEIRKQKELIKNDRLISESTEGDRLGYGQLMAIEQFLIKELKIKEEDLK